MKIYSYRGKKNLSGDKIREARLKQRLSQSDLAAKVQIAGVTLERDSISRIEIGTRFVTDYELKIFERKWGKMFYKVFKTITVDNGSEFADFEGMEKAARRKGSRVKLYYCHPYSSCERGSNENQNRMIRRHVPKGTDFDTVSGDTVKQIEIWINNYPRRLFNYGTAEERFNEEMTKLEGC